MNNRQIKQILLAGYFILSILPFCFGQDFVFDQYLKEKISQEKIHKSSPRFLSLLDSISKSKSEYFESECSQKAELFRNYGAYYYLNASRDRSLITQTLSLFDTSATIINTCEKPNHAIELQILTNIESINYALRKSQYKNSVDSLISYIIEHKNIKDYKYKRIEANAKFRIGQYFRNRKDYDQAIIYLNESLAIYNEIDEKSNKPIRTLRELAINYRLNKDYEKSIEINNKGLALAKKLKLSDIRYTTELLFENINAYRGLGNYKEAFRLLDIVEREYIAKKESKKLFNVPQTKAYIEKARGNNEKALEYYLDAERTIDSKGIGVDAKNLFFLYREISELYLLFNNLSKAENYIIKALQVSSYNIDFDENMLNLKKASITEPQDFLTTANGYINVLIAKNTAPVEIIGVADQIDSIYYSVLPTLSGNFARNALANSYHKMSEIVVEYIFENNLQNRFSNAFAYYTSSSKSKSLLSNFIFQSNVPKSIQENFKELNKEKARVEAKLLVANKNKNTILFDSLAKRNFSLNTEIQSIYNSTNEKSLGRFYKKYRNNIFQKIIDSQNDDFLIDGIIKDSIFYCYTVGNGNYSFHRLNVGFLDTLASQELFTDPQKFNKYEELIRLLSTVFNPIFDKIEEAKSIQFILDGPLLKIPMELLLYNDTQLIQQYDISYLNSFRDDQSLVSKQSSNHRYIGYGLLYNTEVLTEIAESYEIGQIFDKNPRLSPLPGAVKEITTCSDIVQGITYLNSECTKENFINFSEGNQILHISNHVLLNEKDPELSSIVFANNNKSVLLSAHEISGLQLNNDLSILSSCNSGVGKDYTGNGLRSIGQTFFEAGSKAVLVNLWEAGDKSSYKIITSFIQYLKDGKNKSQALRQAKIDFLAQAKPSEKHPKYWANLILIGNDESIVFHSMTKNAKWIYVILGLIASGLIMYFLTRKKQEAAKS